MNNSNNLKNYKTKLISYLLIFVLIFTLFPLGIVKAEEISGEHFTLNNTTIGDKGTMPVVNNSKFIKDRTGKYVLDAGSENRVVYDLGISSSGGTVGTWFKSHTRSKYIIASTDDKNDAILDMYINIDGKLELAVRDNNTNWKIVATSSEIVKLDVWNYASVKWTISDSTLNCTLFLNDNKYMGSTSDFKDFTGAKTGIGCYPASSYNIPLVGAIHDFVYYDTDIDDNLIVDNMNKTNLIGSYEVETFSFNGSTSGDKGTMPIVNNATFLKDESEKYVLDAGSANRVVYDLGISSSGGMMGTWFKSHTTGKYIIASTDDKDDALLDMYINNDGKLELAVRGNNTIWEILVTSSEIVKLDEWNYASIKWTLSGSTLNCTLSLNDNEYTGSTCDFEDFTGAKTGIGCYPESSYNIPLLGLIHDFTYCEANQVTNKPTNGGYQVYSANINGTTYHYSRNTVDSYNDLCQLFKNSPTYLEVVRIFNEYVSQNGTTVDQETRDFVNNDTIAMLQVDNGYRGFGQWVNMLTKLLKIAYIHKSEIPTEDFEQATTLIRDLIRSSCWSKISLTQTPDQDSASGIYHDFYNAMRVVVSDEAYENGNTIDDINNLDKLAFQVTWDLDYKVASLDALASLFTGFGIEMGCSGMLSDGASALYNRAKVTGSFAMGTAEAEKIIAEVGEERALSLSTRFLNQSDPLWENAANIKPIEGYQDIICHGDKLGFVWKDANGVESTVSVNEFAKILKSSPVYKGGPIRLISCETGADDAIAAQYLAKFLGEEVIAPTDIVYVYGDGTMKIGINNTGIWKIFNP